MVYDRKRGVKATLNRKHSQSKRSNATQRKNKSVNTLAHIKKEKTKKRMMKKVQGHSREKKGKEGLLRNHCWVMKVKTVKTESFEGAQERSI